MPELPEVETVRLGLSELLPGRVFAVVAHDTDRSFPNAVADVRTFLVSASVQAVKRRAKVLLIELSSNYSLVIHLKMTGQLVFVSPQERFGAGHPNDSLVGQLPDKSTRVEFTFADGSKLFLTTSASSAGSGCCPPQRCRLSTLCAKLGTNRLMLPSLPMLS